MVIILVIGGVLLVYGCNRQKECRIGMVYNSQTEDCDCFNRSVSEIPELSSDDYNSVLVLRWNFDYNVKSYTDYPYYSHQGDTIKVYGWFWEDIDTILYGDTAPWIGVDCPRLKLSSIQDFAGLFDKKDTCFLTGILEYPNHLDKKAFTEPIEECFLMDDYMLRVVEIHN